MIPEKKKDSEKKRLLPLVVLSLLFYGVMLLLTLTAKDIHNARLPQVTAGRPEKQFFSYTDTMEGNPIERTISCTALPKDMVDSGKVFILQTITKGDFTYYYAQQCFITIDAEKQHADYYAISNGIDSWDTVILTGYENLQNGAEVFLLPKEKNEKNQNKNMFQ